MKAFVCSVGERTTHICCEQLKRFGFEVVLLDGKEHWIDKYKRFISIANEECLRIDADIIPNRNIQLVGREDKNLPMIQYKLYDFYKNDITIGNPILYRKKALDMIKANTDKLEVGRTETSAWRRIVIETYTSDLIVGIHGFAQDKETMERAKKHKIDRGHLKKYNYDFDLAYKIIELIKND